MPPAERRVLSEALQVRARRVVQPGTVRAMHWSVLGSVVQRWAARRCLMLGGMRRPAAAEQHASGVL